MSSRWLASLPLPNPVQLLYFLGEEKSKVIAETSNCAQFAITK